LHGGSQKRYGIRKKDVELKNVMCMLFVKCSEGGFEKLFLEFSQN
jgi:hypothetical protein